MIAPLEKTQRIAFRLSDEAPTVRHVAVVMDVKAPPQHGFSQEVEGTIQLKILDDPSHSAPFFFLRGSDEEYY